MNYYRNPFAYRTLRLFFQVSITRNAAPNPRFISISTPRSNPQNVTRKEKDVFSPYFEAYWKDMISRIRQLWGALSPRHPIEILVSRS